MSAPEQPPSPSQAVDDFKRDVEALLRHVLGTQRRHRARGRDAPVSAPEQAAGDFKRDVEAFRADLRRDEAALDAWAAANADHLAGAESAVWTVELDSKLVDDKWGAADVLGLPDGRALDLDTGTVRRAQTSERVYQCLAVAPEAGEPSEWLRVLGETFSQLEKPAEMIAYLRWWLRYSLRRSCDDESALFLVGPAHSGESDQ